MTAALKTDDLLAGDMLTAGELARRLNISRKTLEDWRRRGNGPRFIRLGRSCVRYPVEDVERFLAARATTPS